MIVAGKLFFIFIILAIILLGIGIGVIRNMFGNGKASNNKYQNDIKLMRSEIKPWLTELTPLEEEGLTLFSLNQVNQVLKKGVNKTAKGVFTSIYQEPILAYSYKEYLGNNALLYARTAQHEMVYQIKKDETKIAVDGKYFATLKKDGKLYNGKTVLGQIDQSSEKLHFPIHIGNKEIATLNNPKLLDAPEPRAFQYVADNISESEEKALVTLAALKLVEQMIEAA